jgi:hypothetical protein
MKTDSCIRDKERRDRGVGTTDVGSWSNKWGHAGLPPMRVKIDFHWVDAGTDAVCMRGSCYINWKKVTSFVVAPEICAVVDTDGARQCF